MMKNWKPPLFFSGALVMAACVLENGMASTEYQESWGPDVRSDLPELSVQDTMGKSLSLQDIAGPSGTLIFVVRSSSW